MLPDAERAPLVRVEVQVQVTHGLRGRLKVKWRKVKWCKVKRLKVQWLKV